MDNINDLVGDAAKQLMAQADGIQNPRLKESAKRVALTVSAKTRDETITKARNAAFARIPIWAFFLPVTRRQQIVLGRIYSFQCTTNKDGSPAEYRMSLSTGASELGMTNRAEMQKGLAQFGLTLAQARERYGKREKARYRKWAETVAFFATDCSFLDIANLVDRSVAQVVHEIHDTWYEDYMLGCIDYIASVAYHGGILLKPITTEKEITGHIGDTILSWCEKGQKDDGGNEFRD